MADKLLMLQGTTTMPAVVKEPAGNGRADIAWPVDDMGQRFDLRWARSSFLARL